MLVYLNIFNSIFVTLVTLLFLASCDRQYMSERASQDQTQDGSAKTENAQAKKDSNEATKDGELHSNAISKKAQDERMSAPTITKKGKREAISYVSPFAGNKVLNLCVFRI